MREGPNTSGSQAQARGLGAGLCAQDVELVLLSPARGYGACRTTRHSRRAGAPLELACPTPSTPGSRGRG